MRLAVQHLATTSFHGLGERLVSVPGTEKKYKYTTVNGGNTV